MSQPTAPQTLTHGSPFKAIFTIILALALFDVMAVFVRILLPHYSPQELSAYRNMFGVLPSLAMLIWTGQLRLRREALLIRQWPLALARGAVVSVAQFTFYTSLGLLELATVAALAQTSAFFVVLFSILFLGERVGAWRWIAVVLGFCGAVWILRPGADVFTLSALLPVVAAAGYALPNVMLRLFDRSVSNALLYVYSAFAATIGSVILVLATGGFGPIASVLDAVLILTMAMCGGVAVLLMMIAYRMAMPSLLAPFSFVSLITSFLFGYLIFGEAPFATLFPGVILIVAAGGLIMWREQRGRRAVPKDLP